MQTGHCNCSIDKGHENRAMRKPAFANAKHKGADHYWLTNAFVVSLTSNIVSLAYESTTSSLYPSSVDV